MIEAAKATVITAAHPDAHPAPSHPAAAAPPAEAAAGGGGGRERDLHDLASVEILDGCGGRAGCADGRRLACAAELEQEVVGQR
eukprot:4102880-Prymnesium_polylepis.1